MAARYLALGIRTATVNNHGNRFVVLLGNRNSSTSTSTNSAYEYDVLSKIGNREVVGFGCNGQAMYSDRVDFPLPAIRFRENTPDIQALREKEKGDWKKLSLEEKKALYRASFCQTFAEFKAPTGEWKSIVGWTLVIMSLSLWSYMGLKLFVYPPLPESFTEENRKKQLKRMLDTEVGIIEGLSSKWDYEKNEWKKQ